MECTSLICRKTRIDLSSNGLCGGRNSNSAGRIGQNSSQARVLQQQNIFTFMIAVDTDACIHLSSMNERIGTEQDEHEK